MAEALLVNRPARWLAVGSCPDGQWEDYLGCYLVEAPQAHENSELPPHALEASPEASAAG